MISSRAFKAMLVSLPVLLLSVTAVGQVSPAGDAISAEEAEGIIFERQNLMSQIHDDTDLLGDIVAGLAPAEQLGPTTASIAESAEALESIFALQVPGGRAKEDVWTNHDDYMARMAEFTQNTARLAELGEAGDMTGVTNMLMTALPCKQCHDVYREPKD